jgi:hypothetical protein
MNKEKIIELKSCSNFDQEISEGLGMFEKYIMKRA